MGSPAGRLRAALHPGVALGAGLALDEDGPQFALGGQGLDRHLVGGFFRAVEPEKHLLGEAGGEVRKDFRGLHRRTLAAFAGEFKTVI